MTGFEVSVIVFGAMSAIVIAALIFANQKLATQIKKMTTDCSALEQKFMASREQSHQELLAIGQRVLDVDKNVRRFSERFDALENNRTADQPQYGQLQNLLKQTSAQQGEASAAEVELLSLLRGQQRL